MNNWQLPCGKLPQRERELRRILFHEGTFAKIISLDNLFTAWRVYRKGKRRKSDVQHFEFSLEDNIFQLHHDLSASLYRPAGYQQFIITDPKTRTISKAAVRDRLLHQAIYQVLYPAFDKTFIFDSYSCRNDKGTHRAFQRLVSFARKVSRNYTGPCWAIKMDIKKFFDSIDHIILFQQLKQRINDPALLYMLKDIIESFSVVPGKGMPLGNLTSQLFANIYMDPVDKFVKHHLRAPYYLRYADDFLILSSDPSGLLGYLVEINRFLQEQLQLTLHPHKVTLRKLEWGIDFVGYVARPHHQLPRRKTVRRIFKKVNRTSAGTTAKAMPSYLGYLSHVSSYKFRRQLQE